MAKKEQGLELFRPGKIGPLVLANRVVMAPMTTRLADAQGHATAEGMAYYRARAAGGVGLVTVEMAAPEPAGKHRRFELGISDDRFLPGLARLAGVIHAEGAKASIQLGHGGGHTRIDICGETPIAPSDIPHSVQEGHTEVILPQAMTRERISRTVQAFADAADRAARAGFDAVEIHGAHGYLLSQFMSPVENRRTDEYGGCLENRARISIEIVRAVRKAAPHMAVIFRMNGDDFFEGGLVPAEALRIAAWVEEAGAHAIHVTAGHYRSQPSAAIMIPPMATALTPFLEFARAVKAVVEVPVIAVGRMGDPAAANAALAAGDADFIALGRPLLADPAWVRTVREGRDVRRCIACNTCVDGMRSGQRLHCIVNPGTGRELEFPVSLVRSGQRIAVIGAGPAGLAYAAEMASENDVTIFEKAMEVGGSFRLAGMAPLFQEVEASVDSLVSHAHAQLRRCIDQGVAVELGIDVLGDPARLAGFDHVVIATGARRGGMTGMLAEALLRSGFARRPPFAWPARWPALRNWFYYRARKPADRSVEARIRAQGLSVETIGDAIRPGKTGAAIASAFAAVYGLAPPQDGSQ